MLISPKAGRTPARCVRSTLVRRILLCLLLAGCRGGEAAYLSAYHFTLGGRPFAPAILSLNGTPGDPQPGDVAEVAGFHLTLGDERSLSWRSGPGVLTEGDRIVALRVGDDPLNVTAEQVRRLRGVHITRWTEEIASQLAALRPDETCVTVRLSDKLLRVPPIKGLKYLRVMRVAPPAVLDADTIGPHEGLLFLAVHACDFWGVNAGLFLGAPHLRYLDLAVDPQGRFAGGPMSSASPLEKLSELRCLELVSTTTGLTDMSIVRSMPLLRRLVLRGSDTQNLEALANHSSLEEVDARDVQLSALPNRVPSLRLLKVGNVPAEMLARFSECNPRCKVEQNRSFEEATERATRLRVRSGGACHRDLDNEQTLYEEVDAEKVAEIAACLQTLPAQPGTVERCRCCGDPTLEFYRGPELLAAASLHHGTHLADRWRGFAKMSAASAAFTCSWLAEHGVSIPMDARERK